MRRREFLATLPALAGAPALRAAADRKTLLLLSAAEAGSLRDALPSEQASKLRGLADATLKTGPWNVTAHRPQGIAVPVHEYYSEGPYWWPDPKNPNGPYIRRDGERNPDRFDDNHREIGTMSTAALGLGMAAYFLDDNRYAEHARKILATWFVDPDTRMNPNLEYGQAVRGINSGRGTGIIDTVALIHAAQGIVLLERAGKLDDALSTGLRRWFADYLRWLTTSEKGLDEKKSGNNHQTWWCAQAAAYALYVNDTSAQKMVWDYYRAELVPHQIRPDGSCPREEERTNSLGYSVFNLDAFSVLCRLAQIAGEDLWRFHTPQGIGVDKAIGYVMPYVEQPDKWHKEQITPLDKKGLIFPGLAGLGLHSAQLLSEYRKLPRNNSPWTLLIDLIAHAEEPGAKG